MHSTAWTKHASGATPLLSEPVGGAYVGLLAVGASYWRLCAILAVGAIRRRLMSTYSLSEPGGA
eukprot:782218-Prorocentrum_minimum.AAC.2